MKKSKLLFIILAILFMLLLIALALDFSRRTSFPGAKKPGSIKPASQTTLHNGPGGVF
jgi:flagellar basal body-associated protein FliL